MSILRNERDTHRPSSLMRRYKINMEWHNLSRAVLLHPIRVILILISPAQIRVAFIVCICLRNGGLDGPGRIRIEFLRHSGPAKGCLCCPGLGLFRMRSLIREGEYEVCLRSLGEAF